MSYPSGEASYSYAQRLAEKCGLRLRARLAPYTISRILARLEPVDKSFLQFAFAAFNLELSQSDYTRTTSTSEELETRQANPQYDWQEAPDVSVFFGHSEKLLQLQQWILEQRCRLVALLGIGGILPSPTP